VTLKLGRTTATGFSISGLATYLQVPELDVCFDLGECPLSAVPVNHVFLTHAHGDHARCLPRHWQLRRMLGIAGEATYYLPESIRAGCEGWVRAEAEFEGVPEEDVTAPPFVGLAPGRPVGLARRKDLEARAFPVEHRVPSLGYTISSKKKKLKPEYQGVPGPEIARLRQEGVDVQLEVTTPELTFIGDCVGASLLKEAHIWDSRILFLEATFLAPGEEALAGKKGHTHLHEIAAALEQLGERVRCEHIVLKHFSMRYSREEIVQHVDRAIPPAFRPRVQMLI
jgi:ribonuclease Z